MHLLGHAHNIFTLLALMGLNDYNSQPTCQLYGNSAGWWGMKEGKNLTTDTLITSMPVAIQQGGLYAASRVIYEVLDMAGMTLMCINLSSTVNEFNFNSNEPKKFHWNVSVSTDNCVTFSKPIKLLSDGHGEFWDHGKMFTKEYKFGYLALEWVIFTMHRKNIMVNIFGQGRPHKLGKVEKKPSSLLVKKMERRVYGYNSETEAVEYRWIDSSEESWVKVQNITEEMPCQVIEPCGTTDFIVVHKSDNVLVRVKDKDDNRIHKKGIMKVYNPCDPSGEWTNTKTWDTIHIPDLGHWSNIEINSSERSIKVSIMGRKLLNKSWHYSREPKDNVCNPNVTYMSFEDVIITINCNPNQ
ncbi:unnamed protein product [Meganyctiphanes norvegica]|uniref:Uncharacterized protein n=1 Tax=Meganyctiphanes norvegica TaxID=48144 RepID=A0AAV2SF91_MEGNR